MRKVVIAIILAGSALFYNAQEASAMLDLFSEKFAKYPYSKIVVNGKESTAKVTMLPKRSHLIEWLDEKGATNFYWVERLNKDGRLVWQAAPLELFTYEYTYDDTGKVKSVLIKIIWPELKNYYITPKFSVCDPAKVTECYRLQEVAIHMLVTAKRDDTGKITGGTMKNTFFTQDGQQFIKEQRINVSYPDANTMRTVFEGFGEPWAYVDAWQEYRLDANGKVIWETCRTFGKHSCDSK